MGAYHEGHLSLFRAAREGATSSSQPVRQPRAVRGGRGPDRYPRDEERDLALAEKAEVDWCSHRRPRRCTPPAIRRGSSGARRRPRGRHRPGHFRVATVCLKLFNIVRPARAASVRRRAAGRGRQAPRRGPQPRRPDPRAPHGARRRRARALVSERLPLAGGARAGSPCPCSRHEGSRPRARGSWGTSTWTTSSSRSSTGRSCWPRPSVLGRHDSSTTSSSKERTHEALPPRGKVAARPGAMSAAARRS